MDKDVGPAPKAVLDKLQAYSNGEIGSTEAMDSLNIDFHELMRYMKLHSLPLPEVPTDSLKVNSIALRSFLKDSRRA